jgi:SAM-dependent methyltransferase
MSAPENIRETVRQRYAEAATRSAAGDHERGCGDETSCCGAASVATTDEQGRVVFGAELYGPETAQGATEAALAASLGCGVPTAVADLHPGEVVLDLGSGAGADVLISARRVAPGGRAIGLDMTEEMLELARRNAAEAGVDNVEIRPTHRVHTHAQAAIIRASHRSEGNTMTATIEVFDPAMCCSTGVCGPSVEPELARFEADLRWLAAQGADVTRYNLAQEPGEFAGRPAVAAMLQSGGEDVLPIVLVDGKVRFSGTRPSRADLAAPLGIKVPVVGADLLAPAGDACCTPTEKATTGCCAPAEQASEQRAATSGGCC